MSNDELKSGTKVFARVWGFSEVVTLIEQLPLNNASVWLVRNISGRLGLVEDINITKIIEENEE